MRGSLQPITIGWVAALARHFVPKGIYSPGSVACESELAVLRRGALRASTAARRSLSAGLGVSSILDDDDDAPSLIGVRGGIETRGRGVGRTGEASAAGDE